MDEALKMQFALFERELSRCYATIERYRKERQELAGILEDQRDRLALDVEFKELEKGGW